MFVDFIIFCVILIQFHPSRFELSTYESSINLKNLQLKLTSWSSTMRQHLLLFVAYHSILKLLMCHGFHGLNNKRILLNEKNIKHIIDKNEPILIQSCMDCNLKAITGWNTQYLMDHIPEMSNVLLQAQPLFVYENDNNSPI